MMFAEIFSENLSQIQIRIKGNITGLTEHYDEAFREYYRCEANNYIDALELKVLYKRIDAETICQEFDWVQFYHSINIKII